jgi:hypothetical protein
MNHGFEVRPWLYYTNSHGYIVQFTLQVFRWIDLDEHTVFVVFVVVVF